MTGSSMNPFEPDSKERETAAGEAPSQEEADRLERERRMERRRLNEQERIAKRNAAKKRRKILIAFFSVLLIGTILALLLDQVIIPNLRLRSQYNDAVELYNSGKYEEAIDAFEALGEYKDSASQILNCKTAIKDREYNAASGLYEAGNYEAAYYAFKALYGYRDSADKLDEIKQVYYAQLFAGAKEGSTVYFGSYPQDYNPGKDDIEWIVLEKEDDRILVLSRYALDCQQYHTTYATTTWETSPLRAWLNETFLSEAFSAGEQAKIRTVTVTADRNPLFDTDPGPDTDDKIFLLSIPEVRRYLPSYSAKECAGTDYCYDQGADKYENGNCWWWLRTPGDSPSGATYVRSDGTISFCGDGPKLYVFNEIYDVYYAVRPAMWITLNS